MGMFGSKKKTYVSSSLYNLAGDPKGKPSFKRTAVAGAIVRGNDIPADLRNSYLGGYAISTRSFARWAESSGYNNAISMGKSRVALQSSFTVVPLQAYLQSLADPLKTVEVLDGGAGVADIGLWAEKYMVDNYLAVGEVDVTKGLEYDYLVDDASGSLKVRVGPTPLEGVADTRPEYVVPVPDYDPASTYVHALYRENTSGDTTGNYLGDWRVIDGISYTEPNLTNWELASGSQNVPTNVSLKTTVTEVTKRPNGATTATTPAVTTRTEVANVTQDVWKREVYIGGSKTDTLDLEAEKQTIQRDYSYVISTETTTSIREVASGGAFHTRSKNIITTTTVREVLVIQKRYRQSVKTETVRSYGLLKMFIYRVGSGVPSLDALVVQQESGIDWLPFIPVRLNNKFVEERDEDMYVWTKKAFKKMFGRRTKIDDIIDSLKENESLGEIDFAHIAFGVPLNTSSQWGLQYIYQFLFNLSKASGHSSELYATYLKELKAYTQYVKEMEEWHSAQNTEWGSRYSKQPAYVPRPVPPKGSISFHSNNKHLHFRQVIEYEFIYEEKGSGRKTLNNEPVSVGHLWWEVIDNSVEEGLIEDNRNKGGGRQRFFSRALRKRRSVIALNWQDTPRTWKRMVMRNAVHTNYPYNSHSIATYPLDALEDKDESSFFFPLNLAIFKDMGIVDASEMHLCSAYLILNSYKVVKKKWYQSGIFKVIVAVVVIVISVYFPPFGTAASSTAGGVLGTNVAVGTAIVGAGASASIIALVGGIANAIAGMVLGAIISRVAGKLLGNSFLGDLVAMVAVVAIGSYQTAASNGTPLSFAESFGSLMKAENLLKLGMSAADGLSSYINKSTMNILQEAQELQEAYSAESRRIQEMYVEQFGAGKVIDPMAFTEAGRGAVENVDSFISRTLMTGMDIAEITHKMLSQFASLTLTLDTEV